MRIHGGTVKKISLLVLVLMLTSAFFLTLAACDDGDDEGETVYAVPEGIEVELFKGNQFLGAIKTSDLSGLSQERITVSNESGESRVYVGYSLAAVVAKIKVDVAGMEKLRIYTEGGSVLALLKIFSKSCICIGYMNGEDFVPFGNDPTIIVDKTASSAENIVSGCTLLHINHPDDMYVPPEEDGETEETEETE